MHTLPNRIMLFCGLMVCLVLFNPTRALATTQVLWVSAYGVDSPQCGDRTRSCRSVSQAVENASPGATIEVGPGHYGDLNYDGKFGGPGEEHFDPVQGCLVCVTKSIRIFSLFGATVTVIDANKADTTEQPTDSGVVKLLADGVTFGSKGHGFTVANGSVAGVRADRIDSVRIEGNIALKNYRSGFHIQPRAAVVSVIVSDNFAFDNDIGFSVSDYGIQLLRNQAMGNLVFGIAISANGGTVADNTSTANPGEGIYFAGANATLRSNTAVGNRDGGLDFGPALGSKITGNTITGSLVGVNAGITFGESVALSSNNIFGNEQCGLLNTTATVVQATGNFWGSAAGPGARPADKVCNFVDGSTTVVNPFATTQLPVYAPQ